MTKNSNLAKVKSLKPWIMLILIPITSAIVCFYVLANYTSAPMYSELPSGEEIRAAERVFMFFYYITFIGLLLLPVSCFMLMKTMRHNKKNSAKDR